MPIVTLPVPDSYESSTRPIAVQIAKNLLKSHAAPKGARIVFPGDTGKIAQPKSTISDKRADENNFLNTDSTVTITVTEEPLEDRILSTAVTKPKEENKFIFFDKELGINMRPVLTPTELTISFRLRFRDKNIAQQHYNNVKTRASLGRAEQLHMLTYHYGVPYQYVYMLTEMWRIRERVDPLNEDMKGWFDRCFSERLTVITNQAGHLDTGVMVIPENQVGVLGWFDFSYQPTKEEREHEGGTYLTGFDYKIQFDKITDMILEYPVMIHNQILPKTIRDDETEETPDTLLQTMQFSKSLFEFMISQQPKYLSGIEGWAYPFFDDWIVSRTPRGVNTLLTVLVEVDPDDKRDLFNIEDIDDFDYDQDVMDFLKTEHEHIARIGKSVFYINMYEGDTSTGFDKVVMDNQLNLRTVDEMSLRINNRVHIGIISDWTMLDQQAVLRLRAVPDVVEILLLNIIGDYPAFKIEVMSNGMISNKSMQQLIELTSSRKRNTGGCFTNDRGLAKEKYGRFTAGEYSILTIKSNP